MRLGSQGADVGALQQSLLEAGAAITSSELSSKSFGPSTEAAVRSFQGAHVDQAGRPLAVDGVAGPATLWAIAHPGGEHATPPGWARSGSASTLVAPVLDAAIADVGRRESPDGSNDGPMLAKFRTGGNPWCALAASTWWSAAPGGSPFGRIAAVVGLRDWAAARGRLVPAGAPVLPGDLFGLLRADGHGHVGLVVGVAGDVLSTVEGNAGNAVRRRIRSRGDAQFIVRPLGPIGGAP